MTSTELESRIVEAEKDPALIRPLIDDFKAHKDRQLSDLTGQVNAAQADLVQQVNAANASVDVQLAAIKAERDAAAARHAKVLAAADTALTAADLDSLKAILTPVVEEEKQTDEERRVAEIRAKAAELRAEADKLEAEISERFVETPVGKE